MRTPALNAALAALLLSLAAPAAEAAPEPGPAAPAPTRATPPPSVRNFGPMDLFALQQATDVQIRPDGGALVYVRAAGDVMRDRYRRSLWLIDVASGRQTPLVTDADSAFAPRWSPDGRRLAYVAVRDGKPRLEIMWLESGRTAALADLPGVPHGVVWSPDGRRLAFAMRTPVPAPVLGAPLAKPAGAAWAEPLRVIDTLVYASDAEGDLKPERDHLYVADADGGAPRQLTSGDFDEHSPGSFTPDGRFLIFSANREGDAEHEPLRSALYRLDLSTLAVERLTDASASRADPQVSPDGRRVAYLYRQDRRRGFENTEIRVLDLQTGSDEILPTRLDRAFDEARWEASGTGLVASFIDRGVGVIARVGLDGRVRRIAEGLEGQELDRPYAAAAFSLARNGAVAYAAGGPLEPGDVETLAPGAPARRLTRLNAELFAGRAFGAVRPLSSRSEFDQTPIDAWMITPPDFEPGRKYPMILEIHGGPYASYGPVFASELQLYASAGYVVVYSNPRGSTSNGFAFADAINDNYPSHDYDDLLGVVDAAVATGSVDERNLFVTGGSGGGLLTSWIVGTTDRFRAAVAQKPVINWTSETLTSDIPLFEMLYWFDKTPWDDPQGYWRRSPLSRVGHVKTPTLLMVGSADHRTPPTEAEQFYEALKIRRIPTELVVVPGANHEGLAGRPSQEAQESASILAWFDRFRVR